eukprot:78051_1
MALSLTKFDALVKITWDLICDSDNLHEPNVIDKIKTNCLKLWKLHKLDKKNQTFIYKSYQKHIYFFQSVYHFRYNTSKKCIKYFKKSFKFFHPNELHYHRVAKWGLTMLTNYGQYYDALKCMNQGDISILAQLQLYCLMDDVDNMALLFKKLEHTAAEESIEYHLNKIIYYSLHLKQYEKAIKWCNKLKHWVELQLKFPALHRYMNLWNVWTAYSNLCLGDFTWFTVLKPTLINDGIIHLPRTNYGWMHCALELKRRIKNGNAGDYNMGDVFGILVIIAVEKESIEAQYHLGILFYELNMFQLSKKWISNVLKFNTDIPIIVKTGAKWNKIVINKWNSLCCDYCGINNNTKKLKSCKRCCRVYYCSRKCQKISWNSTHRYKCICYIYIS